MITVKQFASLPFVVKALESPASPKSVLSFFFGVDYNADSHVEELRDATNVMQNAVPLWFNGGPVFDELCKPFTDVVRQSGKGELSGSEWNDTVDGKVAQIVLCDQLARNLFRGSSESYAYTEMALKLTKEVATMGINGEDDPSTPGNEVFAIYGFLFNLPLMHSELLADHELSANIFTWGKGKNDNIKWAFQEKFKLEHTDVIKRFGRYPHRNKPLGRESTAEEVAYLEDLDNLPMWAGGRKK